MGFRFSRRINILPGIRLNLGSSGVSLSVGGKNASLNVGKRGAFTNVGIPGTGLSYRKRLGGSSPGRAQSKTESAALPDQFQLSVTPQGISFLDADGAPLSRPVIVGLRARRGDDILGFIDQVVDADARLTARLESVCERISAPAPVCRKPLSLGQLPPKPVRTPYSVGSGMDQKGHSDRDEFEQGFMERLSAWRVLEAKVAANAEADLDAIATPILDRLSRLEWPRETNISLDLDPSGETLMLDVDLPEIEDFPDQRLEVDRTALNVKQVRLPITQVREAYARHVHGILLRLVAESFAAHGAIMAIEVSGYTQRQSEPGLEPVSEYILSCRISRTAWDHARLWQGNIVDPVAALGQFEPRRKYNGKGKLMSIKPH